MENTTQGRKLTKEEFLKYKLNSLNHILQFPLQGSVQKSGTYIHVSTVYEAMEEYTAQEKQTAQQIAEEGVCNQCGHDWHEIKQEQTTK